MYTTIETERGNEYTEKEAEKERGDEIKSIGRTVKGTEWGLGESKSATIIRFSSRCHSLIRKPKSWDRVRKRDNRFGTNQKKKDWDREREFTKRDRVCTVLREKYLSSTVMVSFSAAICSLARLRTPKSQAHTGIEIEEEKFKFH